MTLDHHHGIETRGQGDLPAMNLADRRYWIFDMDGTLTVAIHDFDAIRERTWKVISSLNNTGGTQANLRCLAKIVK